MNEQTASILNRYFSGEEMSEQEQLIVEDCLKKYPRSTLEMFFDETPEEAAELDKLYSKN